MSEIVIDEVDGSRQAWQGVVRAVHPERWVAEVQLLEPSEAIGEPVVREIGLNEGYFLLEKGVPHPRLGKKVIGCFLKKGHEVLCCSSGEDFKLDKWAFEESQLRQ